MINSRQEFDYMMGVASADLRGDENLELRARYHDELSRQVRQVRFFKVHDAFVSVPSGAPLFGPGCTRLAVYIIRNPLDVVVSYANHACCSIPQSIQSLNEGRAYNEAAGANFCAPQFADRWQNWSRNVSSWVDQTKVPVFVMRYEDMRADPIATFTRLVEAIGLPLDRDRLRAAVAETSFDKLQAEERVHGFTEKMAGCESFFHRGQVGRGSEVLTKKQVAQIVGQHGEMMGRFGYGLTGQSRRKKKA
jgi:hypothetical protein